MIKPAVCKALVLALVMAIAGITTTSCTDNDHGDRPGDGEVGSLGFRLVVAPGVTVSTVSYTISGNSFSRTGTIDVSGTSNTFSATVDGIPAGNGYLLTLSATASNGTVGTGSATFDVHAGLRTTVAVVLHFAASHGNTGSVLINGSTNVGPLISLITADPDAIAVGGLTHLIATASDADNQPSPLSYAWVAAPAGIGTLSGANSATPTFSALSAGTVTLTVTVSDGDTIVDDHLALQLTVSSAGSAGTGAAGTDAAGTGAAGTTAAGTGAAGTDAAGTGAAGTTAAGTGAAGTDAAGTGAAGTTAAGTGAAGTDAAGTGAAGTTAGAGGSGGSTGSDPCFLCETTEHEGNLSCPNGYNAGTALAGNTPVLADPTTSATIAASGQSRSSTFLAILECFHSTHCASAGANSDCFCGTDVDPNDCFGGTYAAATGPCKELVAAGAESVSIGQINTRFNDPSFAIGSANRVLNSCDQFSCVDECL